MFGVTGRYYRLAVFKQDRVNAARRRIVDTGDGFGAEGVRAQLGLVGKILKRIVVPELHLHAPVQRAPPLRIVQCQGLRRPAALGLNASVGQAQIVLNGEGNAPGNRLAEPYGVAVDAFVPSLKRHVVRIADELDHKVLFAAEIFQPLPDLLLKLPLHAQHPFVVMEGGSQVLDACAMGVAVLIAQLTDDLGPADLDAVPLAGNDHFLRDLLLTDLVVPDLHFHAPLELSALFRRIAGNRPTVTKSFVGDGFGGEIQRALAVFGDRSRSFPRQPEVVAVDIYQLAPERKGIGMTDKVEPHIGATAHAVEDLAKYLKIIPGNFNFAQAEMDGRDQVVEFDGCDFLLDDFAQFRPVALVLFKYGGVHGSWR